MTTVSNKNEKMTKANALDFLLPATVLEYAWIFPFISLTVVCRWGISCGFLSFYWSDRQKATSYQYRHKWLASDFHMV